MQTFYVIIQKNYLSVYEKNADMFEKVYLGGNPYFAYTVNNAVDYIQRFFSMIIEEYNLETVGEVDFVVIENEDRIITDAVSKAMGECIKKQLKIEELMLNVIARLGRDKNLCISEYGVNFDERKYIVTDGKINKDEYSLLSYTLNDDMLIKFVK